MPVRDNVMLRGRSRTSAEGRPAAVRPRRGESPSIERHEPAAGGASPGAPVGELPALELLAVQAVASTAGRGLLLETRQLGPLVLALDDRRIAALQRHLASLAAMGDPCGADRDG